MEFKLRFLNKLFNVFYPLFISNLAIKDDQNAFLNKTSGYLNLYKTVMIFVIFRKPQEFGMRQSYLVFVHQNTRQNQFDYRELTV